MLTLSFVEGIIFVCRLYTHAALVRTNMCVHQCWIQFFGKPIFIPLATAILQYSMWISTEISLTEKNRRFNPRFPSNSFILVVVFLTHCLEFCRLALIMIMCFLNFLCAFSLFGATTFWHWTAPKIVTAKSPQNRQLNSRVSSSESKFNYVDFSRNAKWNHLHFDKQMSINCYELFVATLRGGHTNSLLTACAAHKIK